VPGVHSVKIYPEIWCLAPFFAWHLFGKNLSRNLVPGTYSIKIYREIWCLAPFCLARNLVPGTFWHGTFCLAPSAWHPLPGHPFAGRFPLKQTRSDPHFSIKIYREIWCLAPFLPGTHSIKIYREIWCLAPFGGQESWCLAPIEGRLFGKNLSGNLVPGTYSVKIY
jgi:hypothetical protein